MIREARTQDAAAIAAILNRAIVDTTITFTTTPVDAADRAAWIAARQAAGYPVLVAEEPGGLLGYATYGPFRSGEGYARTVEHSIYIVPAAQGRGLGRALMAALIAQARAQGRHAMVGAVTAENTGSGAFHAALGFSRAGVLPECGWKFGRRLDLEFWWLLLEPGAA